MLRAPALHGSIKDAETAAGAAAGGSSALQHAGTDLQDALIARGGRVVRRVRSDEHNPELRAKQLVGVNKYWKGVHQKIASSLANALSPSVAS